MLRNKQDNSIRAKTNRLLEFKNRFKLSGLVFGAVIAVGLVWAGIGALMNRGSQSATAVQDSELKEIPTWWFSENFGVAECQEDACQPESDPDKDKLTNQHEYFYSTDPNKKDTNDNGLSDGEDVAFGYAPNKPGRVSFEEAASDESIVGESLLFESDVKDILVQMSDLSKVPLPEINDAELNILPDVSGEAFVTYMLALNDVSAKHAKTKELYANISERIKQQDPRTIAEMKQLALTIREEYRKVPVPQNMVQIHKYHLALWDVLPKILEIPKQTVGDPDFEAWYDNAQVMIALNQKIAVELQKVRNILEVKK